MPLKSGVGHNIATYASPTARDFFLELISTFLVHSSASPRPKVFFYMLAVANTGSCVGLQNKIDNFDRRSGWFTQVPVLSV